MLEEDKKNWKISKEKESKIEKLTNLIKSKLSEIADLRRKYNFSKNKETWALEKLKGIKKTTGQHPGALLVLPSGYDIKKITPLNHPANDKESGLTTHFDYGLPPLSGGIEKIDILGHEGPSTLGRLQEETGIGREKIEFSIRGFSPEDLERKFNLNDAEVLEEFDEEKYPTWKIMRIFYRAETLGIPEFGTDFVRGLLNQLKPRKFSDLIKISGFSHGTNVWSGNQQIVFKNFKTKTDEGLDLENLIACREDILSLLESYEIKEEDAFVISEFIRKGKWANAPENLKKILDEKLSSKKGRLYLSILEKIVYIFPKPHAISYTKTAWQSAFYKVYYKEEFYSVLLTHHATLYDIWLMSLKSETIIFYLQGLVDSIDEKINNRRDLISIIKVLQDLLKKAKKKELKNKKTENGFSNDNVENVVNVLEKCLLAFDEIIKKTNNQELISLVEKEKSRWERSRKEKDLLFTLEVMQEMKEAGLNPKIGIDLNHSLAKIFFVKNGIIYFPFNTLSGMGPKISEKIINYREKKKISKNWEEELSGMLNVNQIKKLNDLDQYGLMIFS